MINAKLLRDQGILVVSPVDKLESTDFERLRLLTDPYIEKQGNLKGLLIDAEAFFGWEDFSDNGFLAILPKVADHFVAAEVRHFDYHDRDEALRWLRGGSGNGH